MAITYPEDLPRGLYAGRSYQLVNPLVRSELQSGRARQRRRFTNVPEGAQISWLFNSAESRAFIAWWRDALADGSLWFECPLDHPGRGYQDYTCRFTGPYAGPSRVGPDLWSFTAELELRERVSMPPGWGEFPEFIIDASILDFAMNREWPLHVVYTLTTEDGFVLTTEDGFALTTE